MKVLMLGWEYPPHISGGLGTACEGLTRAMAARGVQIDFVLPKKFGSEKTPHMRLMEPEEFERKPQPPVTGDDPERTPGTLGPDVFYGNAYSRPGERKDPASSAENFFWAPSHAKVSETLINMEPRAAIREIFFAASSNDSNSIFKTVERFTNRVEKIAGLQKFQVIHAHDWMTFPAGIIAARKARVPLVVHVHSLEFDRAGQNGDPVIHAIEAVGIRAADRIVTVSQYTRDQITRIFGVPSHRISVAHNGVDPAPCGVVAKNIAADDRPRVLFLGRVTYQKGPDYFIEAAALAARKVPEAVFVIAGSGDMLHWARVRVRELGLESRFEFPGFVKGEALENEFRRARVYVMPSVSEPFGIAALEAVHRGTPTILSKQSGVAEVMRNVFKVDFWDIYRMADLMVNLLLYPELGSCMKTMATQEVQHLGWDTTAERVSDVYADLLARRETFIV